MVHNTDTNYKYTPIELLVLTLILSASFCNPFCINDRIFNALYDVSQLAGHLISNNFFPYKVLSDELYVR